MSETPKSETSRANPARVSEREISFSAESVEATRRDRFDNRRDRFDSNMVGRKNAQAAADQWLRRSRPHISPGFIARKGAARVSVWAALPLRPRLQPQGSRPGQAGRESPSVDH
jgi:hypothetical protein